MNDQEKIKILERKCNELRIERDAYKANSAVAMKLAQDRQDALMSLVDNSEGVYGLHLNGAPSPWSELLPGGYFETWLYPFEEPKNG